LIPGTVEFHTPPPAVPSCAAGDVQAVPRRHFVGGVSDGTVGFAAMDYGATEDHGSGSLWMHRSWFMVDDVVVVVGIGNITSGSVFPVTTSLDQRLLSAVPPTVAVGGVVATMAPGINRTFDSVEWLHHGKVGYAVLGTNATTPGVRMVMSTLRQAGSWFDITQGDQSPVEHDVFSAYVDHGVVPRGGRIVHQYVVMPGVPAAEAMPGAVEELTHRLSVANEWAVQHACDRGSGPLMMATHWYSGTIAAAAAVGCWDVDFVSGIEGQGAMIMLQRGGAAGTGLLVHAANPHAIGGQLHFRVSGRYAGGGCTPATAGNSTTITLTVPPNSGPNGQGVSGRTVSTECTTAEAYQARKGVGGAA